MIAIAPLIQEVESYYQDNEGEYACDYIRKYCKHTVGKLRGQPVEFIDFQKRILNEALGWKLEGSGLYKNSVIYVEIPRGNAKSTIGLCLGMYKNFGAGIRAARGYCFSGNLKQADGQLFKPVRDMVMENEYLTNELETYHNFVRDPMTDSIFYVMSAEPKNGHSIIPSDVQLDELHLQPNSKLWDGIYSGKSKRTDCTCQVWIWTTAGVVGSFAWDMHKYALGVRDGTIQDDSFIPFIWSASEKDDPFDPVVWQRANPGWSFLNQREFEQMAKRAERNPRLLNAFKRYNLNMWTGSHEAWIPVHDWNKCDFGKIDVEQKSCYIGVYLASVTDLTCICLFYPGEPHLMEWYYFCPAETIRFRDELGFPYRHWQQEGYIISTPGLTADHGAVENKILELSESRGVYKVGNNSREMIRVIQELEDKGLEVVPWSTTQFGAMSVPSKEFETMVIEQKLNHGGNPVSCWMIESTFIAKGDDDMIRPSAKGSNDNICGIMAAVIAVGLWVADRDGDDTLTAEDFIV